MALSLSSEEIVTYSFEAALLRDVLLSNSNSNKTKDWALVHERRWEK